MRSLTEKIAAVVPARSLALSVTNASPLSAADAAAISGALSADLQSRGFAVVANAASSADIQVRLTLSEGADGYVWIAQIHRGADNSDQVEIVAAPRQSAAPFGSAGKSLALNRRMIWQQRAQMLDFALLPSTESLGGGAPAASGLVILEPERLAFYVSQGGEWLLNAEVSIPHAAPWPRDLTGQIDPAAGKAALPGVNCEGDFAHPESWRCAVTHQASAKPALAGAQQLEIDGQAADFVALGKVCEAFGPILLVTGNGDWTEPDLIRAYDTDGGSPVALGQPIEFPGPILAHTATQDGRSARIVLRNLETGMYEASIVSVSCGD